MSEREPTTKKSQARLSSLFRRKTVIEDKHKPTPISSPVQAPVSQYPAYIAEYQFKSQPQSPISPPRHSQTLAAGKGNYRPYPEPIPAQFPVPGSLVFKIEEREAMAATNSQNHAMFQSSDSPMSNPEEATRVSSLSGRQVTGFPPTSHRSYDITSIGSAISRPSVVSTLDYSDQRPYEYTPLETGFIRLIRIAPGHKTIIECEMIQALITNTPQYVAISYTWGDVGDTRKVDIEGSRVPVTVNLYGALEALRQKQSSVLVWADALCINQKNTEERSQHVQLMVQIYANAAFVAIWLGPEDNGSTKAVELLSRLAPPTSQPIPDQDVSRILAEGAENGDLLAAVSLFGRDYWKRLWVSQEIFHAKRIAVHCGETFLPWQSYKSASAILRRHHAELLFKAKGPDMRRPDKFSCVQTLIHGGPASLPTLHSHVLNGEGALLEVLRASRGQSSSDPRDKLYGVLGVLPAHIRHSFRVDYNLSVKDVYTEIVEFLIQTTEKLDVICESVHFPTNTGSVNLPSFVPDWSHVPLTSAMGPRYGFHASGPTKAICRFQDERMNKLEISGIEIDIVQTKGMVVGTLCNLGDFLMAFLHWRALLLAAVEGRTPFQVQLAEEAFIATICLGQITTGYDRSRWKQVSYHVIANLFRERLLHIPLDDILRSHLNMATNIPPEARRQFLQTNFGDRMMGRTFCLTKNRRLGLGSGAMLPEDVVVVPLGCSTPVLLRPEGTRGEYRYVGDIYIENYMFGKAVDQWQAGARELKKYVLH
ncbi:heterokaryon incompatibility protein [Fusarium langsethiae]|uniref:Heterokaryon incompatibility protein n=1 Tax=Fusarium langsethiae TaxID=179993 RepID=A0A0N0DE87_FUSLA|nr:heterokaryon incompatibility protein [Fusarium langsethiae]GKU03867.1 unnamed protein product [Fusarium langsethiae]GKU18684.1 unnamed protein product [Fusarium langsethiae]